MTTTGELRTIIQELQLIHIGNAASYLGEESMVEEELQNPEYEVQIFSDDLDISLLKFRKENSNLKC